MGNKNSRSIATFSIMATGIILGPFTGGVSSVAALGLVAARQNIEIAIDNNYVHNADLKIEGITDSLKYKKIIKIEIIYCHISDSLTDASATLIARATFMTEKAAHHHYLIITLESGEFVYFDKHSYRNILVRPDKKGKNGPGNEWINGYLLKRKYIYKNTNLGELIEFVKNNTESKYHLLDNNCQHFCEEIYKSELFS